MTDRERFELECYRATEHDASGAISGIVWKKVIDALDAYLESSK